MKVEADNTSVEGLLKNSYFFIPRFQRPYSWELDNVQEFWDDLSQNIGKDYFIGSMVMYETAPNTLAVVDGQQRLTTITILLCCIRDAFTSPGRSDLADGVQNYIERNNRDNNKVFVLKTETSFPYLQEMVLKNGEAELEPDVGKEEEAIAAAAKRLTQLIQKEIRGFSDDGAGDDEDHRIIHLKKIRDTALDLIIIKVQLAREEDAYLIFETLNTRGKDLALSDLVKNHLTKLIPKTGEVDSATHRWNDVLSTIVDSKENLEPDTFITHFWQSRYDFLTKAKVFAKLRKDVRSSNGKKFLGDFEDDAKYWRSIFDVEYEWTKTEKKVRKSLEALRIFRVQQPTPGILSIIRAYRKDKIKLRSLTKCLEDIENFYFAFTGVTQSRSTGGISGMFASFGRKVFVATDASVIGAEVAALKDKLRERMPSSSEFDAGFEQIHYTRERSGQKALVRYILGKVAEYEKQPTVGHTDELTIEHLVPQASLKKGVSAKIVGQLGNLILVDQETNSRIGNKSFPEKRDILVRAGYRLPTAYLEADDLSSEMIESNTSRISNLARTEVWAL